MERRIVNLFCCVILFLCLALSCSKKDSGCRTCKASFIDAVPVEKTVCTDNEEQNFRDENPSAQVTCH